MASKKSSWMPKDGGDRSDYTIRRVDELNDLFTNIGKLNQSIDEDRAERELEILRKVEKYKKQIREKELKEEQAYLRKKEQLERTYRGKALQDELDAAAAAHKAVMDNIAAQYKKRAEEEARIEKQFKGTIGGLVGDIKKGGLYGGTEGVMQVFHALGSFLQKFDNMIEEIAGYQTKINTRLMGSGRR